MQSLSQTRTSTAPARTGGTQPATSASPAAGAAHTIQVPPKRGMAKGEAWGTTRRDYAVDPTKAKGEALAVFTSSGTAVSSDAISSTMRYFEALDNNPFASEADLWTEATRRDVNQGGSVMTFQQPKASPAQGQAAAGRGQGADGRLNLLDGWQPAQMQRDNFNLAPRPTPRFPTKGPALVVGNYDYRDKDGLGDLPGAKRDAAAMARRYADRGYAVQHVNNLDAGALSQALRGLVQGLKPKDEAAFYYAGHGVPNGLVGVDSVLSANGQATKLTPPSEISGAVSGALSAGAKLEVVTDACSSGFMTAGVEGAQAGRASLVNQDKQGVNFDAEAKAGFSVTDQYLDQRTKVGGEDLRAAYEAVHAGG